MVNFLVILVSLILIIIIHYILNLNRTFLVIFLSSLVFLLVSFVLIYNGLEFFGLIFVIIYIGAIVVMFLFLIVTVDMSAETLKQQNVILNFNFFFDILIILLISTLLYMVFYYIIVDSNIYSIVDSNVVVVNFDCYVTFSNNLTFYKVNETNIVNILGYFESKLNFNDINGYLGTYVFSQNFLSLVLIAVLLLVALLVSINICISR